MRVTGPRSACAGVCVLAVIAVFLSAAPSPPKVQETGAGREITLQLDPDQSKVHFTVESRLHMVHGTFHVKGGTMRIDPDSGKAGGEITVLATSGDSGNESRDTHMHEEILETQKYPDLVFRPTQVEGKVAGDSASDVKLHGVMSLHGGEHEIVVPVRAELASGRWKGSATFEVPYVAWGVKDPSNWMLKVKHVVNVELDFAGTVAVKP